jgi:predicted ABC-type ATPase
MSSLIIIGGPNGSGKTTLTSYLIQKGRIKSPVINPDEIAFKELGGYKFQFKAARIALGRRKNAINNNSDTAFETTLSGNTEINDILTAKAAGYKIILYYVALRSVLDNIIRVEQRITNAGHNVETEDISRRYLKSQSNLENHLGLFDKAYLFDNSGPGRSRVAIFGAGELLWLNEKHINHPFYSKLFKS